MRLRSIVTVCALVCVTAAEGAEPAAASQEANEAVRKGLAFVESKSLSWLRDRHCASCHHVPFMVWAQRDARVRGFAIDEQGYDEAVEFLLADENRAGIVPKPEDPDRPGNPFSLISAFTIFAFRDGGKGVEPPAQEIIEKA